MGWRAWACTVQQLMRTRFSMYCSISELRASWSKAISIPAADLMQSISIIWLMDWAKILWLQMKSGPTLRFYPMQRPQYIWSLTLTMLQLTHSARWNWPCLIWSLVCNHSHPTQTPCSMQKACLYWWSIKLMSLFVHQSSKNQFVRCRVQHRQTNKLALLPLVKRQVFCVGDRLKMDKHKAW